MSSEQNAELVRRWVEAFNARDIEVLITLSDRSIELHSALAAIDGATYHGHAGMRRWHQELQEGGNEVRVEPEVYFELGDGILGFYVAHARGRQSGAEVEMPAAFLTKLRDGRVTYLKVYLDRADAMRDAGVCEGELKPTAL